MEIAVVFTHETSDKKYGTGWGFSCLVDGRLLFDAGEKGKTRRNLGKMGFNPAGIDTAVISHRHSDHTGGLAEIAGKNPKLRVVVCPSDKERVLSSGLCRPDRLEAHGDFYEIEPGVFVTGEMPGTYKGREMPEQALVLRSRKGLGVLTGCSHPGILEVLDRIISRFPNETPDLVCGGFHLRNEKPGHISEIVRGFKARGVRRVAPAHCTGRPAEEIFKNVYGDECLSAAVGERIVFGE